MDANRLLLRAQKVVMEALEKGELPLDKEVIEWLEDVGDYLQMAGVAYEDILSR